MVAVLWFAIELIRTVLLFGLLVLLASLATIATLWALTVLFGQPVPNPDEPPIDPW